MHLPRAIGKSQVHHNLYPTSTKHLALAHRAPRQATHGEMMVGTKLVQDLDLYRPADFDGKVLQLHYARAEELGPYLGLVAAQGEVYVQVWLRAGDAAVEVSLSDERLEEAIPDVLRQHL